MAFSFVAHGSSTNGGTSTASIASVDTTGVNILILIAVAVGSGATPTDNKSNTWTRAAHGSNGVVSCDIWYSFNPAIGSGHTFSVTGTAPSLLMMGFSVTGTLALDQTNTNTGGAVSSVSTGSVTPAVVNELLVAGVAASGIDISSIDSSFTLEDHIAGDGATVLGTGSAYQIQTTATTRNPTFTFSSSCGQTVAAIATFKFTINTATGNFFLMFP